MMPAMLHLVLTYIWLFHMINLEIIFIGATSDVIARKPFGVRMCENLCNSFPQCQTPQYSKKDLGCYIICSNGISESGIRLNNTQNKSQHQPYRKLVSKTKEIVFNRKKRILGQLNRKKPVGYFEIKSGRKTYLIKRYTNELTWGDAHIFCQSEGADLIKVDSKQKQVAIKRKVCNLMKVDGKDCMWIGLTDPNKNNKYRWTDGTPMVYKNWYTTRLSNFTGSEWDTECVCMNRLFLMGLHWKDMDCNMKHGFFCEIR